jgi:hypothetical protein
MGQALMYALMVPAVPLATICWLVTPLPDHSPISAAAWSWAWAVLIIVLWEVNT